MQTVDTAVLPCPFADHAPPRADADAVQGPFAAATRRQSLPFGLLVLALLALGLLAAGLDMASDIGRGLAMSERRGSSCVEVPNADGPALSRALQPDG